jgi:hypothetical protein
MLPEIIELKILEYLSIKPRKRCRATNNKGNICKKNAKKGYLICHHHKQILERSSKKHHIQFAELCIMLRRVIKNNQYTWYGSDPYNAWWSREKNLKKGTKLICCKRVI